MDRDAFVVISVVFVLIAGLIGAACCWDWHRAGIQAAVYKRQGIEMTQWEVFVGATPAEYIVRTKNR